MRDADGRSWLGLCVGGTKVTFKLEKGLVKSVSVLSRCEFSVNVDAGVEVTLHCDEYVNDFCKKKNALIYENFGGDATVLCDVGSEVAKLSFGNKLLSGWQKGFILLTANVHHDQHRLSATNILLEDPHQEEK